MATGTGGKVIRDGEAETAKRGRGRPRIDDAKTGAERQAFICGWWTRSLLFARVSFRLCSR